MSIKSSLEIALERTRDVQADPETLQASGFVTAGKKLVPQFLNDPEFSLARKVREYDGKERKWVSDGVFDALCSNLALPSDEYGLKRNRRAMEGFSAILRDQRRLRIMGQQLEQFFTEYFQERQQLKQNVDLQYAPRLQQKEEELARRSGSRVRIDPATDPEYVQMLRQHMALLEDRYGNVLQQVKQELSSMFGPGTR
jgi:hypothetical protein